MNTLWLALDFETNGLDLENSRIIEYGLVLFEPLTGKIIKTSSDYLYEDGLELTSEIENITGINLETLKVFGKNFHHFIYDLKYMADCATHIVAHNGNEFDKPILESNYARYCQKYTNADNLLDGFIAKLKWIDTRIDVPYKKEITTRKLEFLCAQHGFLNPFSHRALFDCLSMVKLISQYDPINILKRSESDTVTLIADVGFNNKEAAKDAGFHWVSKQKQWRLKVKECDVPNLKLSFNYKFLENMGI